VHLQSTDFSLTLRSFLDYTNVEYITLISKVLADGDAIDITSGALSGQYSLDWNVTMEREDTTVTTVPSSEKRAGLLYDFKSAI
jgi:hypothetical protein